MKLSTSLHEKTMEQNRKHHRRRRLILSSSISTNNNRTMLKPNPVISCHQYYIVKSHQLVVSIATVVVLLYLSSIMNEPQVANAQQQHNFLLPGHNMENFKILESQPVDSVVYQLRAVDRQNENKKFSYHMTGDTFSVDEQTGEVKLIKPLDRERQPLITVIISVFDNSDSKNDLPVESKRRTITVEDIDDSWPIWTQHRSSVLKNVPQGQYIYQAELSELAPINSVVLSDLQVTDADEGINAEVVFECRQKQSTNSACDVFSIEPRQLRMTGKYSITLRTKIQLDFERIQSYKLALVARGRRPSPLKGVPLESEAIININLINVQDEGPQFINAPYSLSMQEGIKPGTRLLNLIVQDGDSAPQRDLSIIVVPGPFSEYFHLQKETEIGNKFWYLETKNIIDRENPLISEMGNMFTISVLAAELDDGMPVASEEELLRALKEVDYSKGTLKRENITIMVLDLPDSRPMFVQASTGIPLKDNVIEINISEATVTGTSIPNLDLAVQDLDQGINSRFNLSLLDIDMGPMASSAFGLESEIIYGKAEIVINVLNSSLLDYENPQYRLYKFNLVASKNSEPSLVQILELHINILDANDNAPEFDRDQYVVEVVEGAKPETIVAVIRARDRDSGLFGKIDYALRGQGASKFKLNPSEGKIMVNDCGVLQCLDYEVQPSFSLTYEARDGGGRMKNVSVIINVIDINDHTPKFTESVYKRELISDNLSSKQNYISPQLIVRAIDGDGPLQGKNNLTYRIKSSNLTNLDVDPESGLVYLSQPIDLDNIISSISESSSSSSGLNNNNNGKADQKKIVFEAEVVAEDNGQPMQNSTAKILITVKGNPEGAPQFKQDLYLAIVRENQPINKPFFQVQAIDPDDKDSQLRYSLGYDLNDLVTINPLSGELSFKTKIDYDEFKGVPYNITVYATDNSRPYPLKASAIVSIQIQDVNDKPPKFEENEYKATLVQGKTKPGDVVLMVKAVDLDKSASLDYSILSDKLTIHDRNGQEFSLDELANSTLGYLSFMGKQERLQLVSSLRKLFYINKITGAIELKSEPDYSFAASITVLVRVLDTNQEIFFPTGELQQSFVNCTFFLQTHVDKSPIFAPPWSIDKRDYSISMMEEQLIGTPIFSLLAKDPITNQRIEMFEKVFESDPKDYFRVEKSGVVLINKRIDYEDLPVPKKLTVSVKALSNDAFYSVANLQVQVVDLNDNSPQFKQQNYSVTISELATYPQEILTLTAEDKDSGEFSRIHYSLSGYSSEFFAIDPLKGKITIQKGVKLDRDSEPNHSLIVTASDCYDTEHQRNNAPINSDTDNRNDNCKKSSVFVNIILSDENDNDPIFANVNKRGEFEAITSETVSVGSVITQAQAIDLDEGVNGQVSYEIVRTGDDTASKLITIDRDGYISVAEPLSGLGRAVPYRITIRAFDHGAASRQTFANLLLTISDVVANDGVPRFIRPKPDEVVLLSENAGPSTFVYQVQAVDPDEETNGKLMYKFIQSTDVFEIDPFTGVIKTQYRPNFYLDRELVPNYTLIIVAQDLGSPPKQAHQVLTIKITDVNDNEPYFERGIEDPPLVLYVEEEIPKESLVGTIQAVDKDIGSNALIGYEIIDGNHNNMFKLSFDSIDSANETFGGNNPCRIYSTSRLDRETKENYLLTIKASSMSKMRNPFLHQLKDPLGGRNTFNQYNASDLTKIRVLIKLLDINDNRPMFLQQNAKSVVDSSAEVYSQLLVFKAIDADSSNSEIQYSILEALFHSDSRYRLNDDTYSASGYHYSGTGNQVMQPVSMKHVFDMDQRSGILRNSVPLRPYIDGYFEIFVKADSGSYNLQQQQQQQMSQRENDELLGYNQLSGATGRKVSDQQPIFDDRCYDDLDFTATDSNNGKKPSDTRSNSSSGLPYGELENCFVAVTKAVVFVTHQRETFRFVFNKTKLNDRLDEFKVKVQSALEELMFDMPNSQASTHKIGVASSSAGQQESSIQPLARAEKVYLNTFNTDFFEREDGSLDFNTLTSCSQLVKFDDRFNSRNGLGGDQDLEYPPRIMNTIVPNQVINYDEVVNLLKTLNATQSARNQKGGSGGGGGSLFSQYGLVNIERCLTDKTMYRMSISERAALYFAAMIAIVGLLLALIVSKMRKSYEKNLKLLQRSKYQYMNQYATLPPGIQPRPSHHLSLAALQQQAVAANGNNFMAPPYGAHSDYDGPGYDTWQL